MVVEQVRVEVALARTLHSLTASDVAVSARPVEADMIGELAPAESELVASAARARQDEFAAGRLCARDALFELGISAAVIGRGTRGEPLWPPGCTGSISHAGGIAAAMVARQGELPSVGIDIERSDSLEESLWPIVLLPSEQSACKQSSTAVECATMLFALKEALFKALYPLDRVELDFLDIELSLRNPDASALVNEFVIEHTQPAAGTRDLRPVTAAAATTSGFVIAVVTVS